MHALTADQISLVPKIDLSRRVFAVTSLAAGFASAVTPVGAATITTDAEGLDTGEAKVRVHDGEIPAYYARPKGTGPFPTVLVVQEIFGVHEHIKDICRRFGKQGYLAVAPALYAREGDVSTMSDINRDPQPGGREGAGRAGDAGPRRHRRLGQGRRQGRHVAARHHRLLLGRPVRLALRRAQPRAEGGRGLVRPSGRRHRPLQPKNPIDLVDQLKAPVLGLYGGKDQGIPVASVEQMREAVSQAGKTAELGLPRSRHGFHADYRPSYDEPAAKDGWDRCLAWFRQHGVG